MASPPLYITPVPKADIERGDGPLVTEFVEGFCRITKESLGGTAGELLRMRQWQKNIIGCVYARRPDGRLRHRQALIGLPRKNGKSALGSAMALHGLVMGDFGSEVFSCAVDKDQARVVFGMAKKMVELDPQLDSRQGGIIRVFRDALEYTDKGSVYRVLSSEAITKEGLSPNLVIYDELHGAPDPELYDVMTLAMGARKNPLLVAITTAGTKSDKTGGDSTCFRLYQHGCKICTGEVDDPTFFMCWFGSHATADFKDPAVWQAANPGYGDLVDSEDFASVIKRVHENEYRTKRLNTFVSAAQAWLPQGTWSACRSDREFTPGKRGVVLGFDGSRSGDCTALVAVSIDAEPQVKVLGFWQKPENADDDWRVPRGLVKDVIRQSCRDFRDAHTPVREIAADEYIWTDALEELEADGLPVVTFPQTLSRMAPATQRMYEMVVNNKLTHDGHPALTRHFDNCVLKTDSRGSRVVKDSRNSPRKIDLAMATIMAVDRAGFWLNEPLEGSFNGVPVADIQFVWGEGDPGRVSIGESCHRCGNRVMRHPDGSQRLKRVGFQVVCTPPCVRPSDLRTPGPKPQEVDDGPGHKDGFYQGYMVT